jgi:integrase
MAYLAQLRAEHATLLLSTDEPVTTMMHAYITLSLLAGLRTEEARALQWADADLDGDQAASPPVPRAPPSGGRSAPTATPRPNGPAAPSRSPPPPSRRHQGVAIEEIARLAGHASTRTTEIVYRRELRPVITTGAEIMDRLFTRT